MTQPMPASPFLLVVGPKPTDEVFEAFRRTLQERGLPPDMSVRRTTIGTWEAQIIDSTPDKTPATSPKMERNRLQTALANELYAPPGYPAAILVPASIWNSERTQYMCVRILASHIRSCSSGHVVPAVVFFKQVSRYIIEEAPHERLPLTAG